MRYVVSGHVTVSCTTLVEADSAEQAREIAMQRGVMDMAPTGGETAEDAWEPDTDGIPTITDVGLA